MRSRIALLLLVFVLPAVAQDRKRVAVLDFEYGTVRSSSAAIFGTDIDVGKGIRDLMVQKLVEGGVYSVIERAALDAVMAEQEFSNSDRANPTSAAQLGRLLGVDAMIIGSITQFGRDDQSRGVGAGAFGGFGRKLGIGGVKQEKSKAVVAITARMINIDTAEILAVSTGRGESKREGTALYGGGAASGTGGFGGLDMTSSNFGATLVGEAVTAAVDPVVVDLQAQSDRLVKRKRDVQGVVADFDQGIVILNVGSGVGVAVGDRFEIQQVVREVRDPTSGKVLRRITNGIGIVEITEVDAGSSVGRFSGDGTPEVGNVAALVLE